MAHSIDDALGSKIEALLRLSEDETPMVRAAVAAELQALEIDLGAFIHERRIALNETQWRFLDGIHWNTRRQRLVDAWVDWLACDDGPEKLEQAVSLLSAFQNGARHSEPLADQIDAFAHWIAPCGQPVAHRRLARCFFDVLGFSCTPKGLESSADTILSRVIETRSGSPISLVCIYILLAHRLGLPVTGCNWPGSYYARFTESDELYLVDFQQRGVVLPVEEMLRLQGPSRDAAKAVVALDMTTDMFVRRMLSHIAYHYRREGDTRSSLVVLDLLRSLDRRIKVSAEEAPAP